MAASAPTLGPAVIVVALYDIEAADRDFFLDLVRTDIEITRGKPGCLWYSLAEDVVEDNVFRLSEGWATREDLEAHFVSEPFQRTVAAVSTLTLRDRVAYLYNISGAEFTNLPAAAE